MKPYPKGVSTKGKPPNECYPDGKGEGRQNHIQPVTVTVEGLPHLLGRRVESVTVTRLTTATETRGPLRRLIPSSVPSLPPLRPTPRLCPRPVCLPPTPPAGTEKRPQSQVPPHGQGKPPLGRHGVGGTRGTTPGPVAGGRSPSKRDGPVGDPTFPRDGRPRTGGPGRVVGVVEVA